MLPFSATLSIRLAYTRHFFYIYMPEQLSRADLNIKHRRLFTQLPPQFLERSVNNSPTLARVSRLIAAKSLFVRHLRQGY